VRESFFLSQVRVKHEVAYSNNVDFLVSGSYEIEIGGKNKTKKQLAGLDHALIVLDNIEVGYGNQLPLWLFGLTY
jgi:hypothetical protein